MPVLRCPICLALCCVVLLTIALSACNPAVVVTADGAPGRPSPSPEQPSITASPTDVQPPQQGLAISTELPRTRATQTPTTSTSPHPTHTLRSRATPTATAIPSRLSGSLRQHIFTRVWQIVDEHYLYADFDGLDWNNVWHEFAPRVDEATTPEEFYALITEMVNRLNDHHSRFLAPSDAVAENALTVGHEEHVGIGVITIPTHDGAIIQHVFSNSPASQAGLRPRDRIVAIDGEPFAAGRDIAGEAGTQVRLTVERPDEHVWDVVLTRRHVEGRISPTAYRLPDNIGYLSIPTLWINDMADQVSGALTDLVVEKPLHGLILDLRDNPGGWRNVLTSILGHFVQGEVGLFFDRQGERPLIIHDSSGPDLRGLPLVVLVDRNTASYAEIMAAILQTEAGAYIIGAPTSGNTETIYAYELPDGARLWVAQEGFRLRNGTNLEGAGVKPDIVLDLDWTRYSEERDPYILDALRYLRER